MFWYSYVLWYGYMFGIATCFGMGHAVVQLVEALRYKPDSRWCHWNFSFTKYFWPHYGPGIDSASNRNEYKENFLKSGSLNFLAPYVSVQAYNGIALLYMFWCSYVFWYGYMFWRSYTFWYNYMFRSLSTFIGLSV
jgi:hypothetical protein